MNTLSTHHHDLTLNKGVGATLSSALKRAIAALDRLVADGLDRARRSEHERFLSRASDPYALERLEREWERRGMDTWRAR